MTPQWNMCLTEWMRQLEIWSRPKLHPLAGASQEWVMESCYHEAEKVFESQDLVPKRMSEFQHMQLVDHHVGGMEMVKEGSGRLPA